MSLSLLLMGLLGPAALVAASPVVDVVTVTQHTIVATVTSTLGASTKSSCPTPVTVTVPVTVYPSTCAAAASDAENYITTILPGASEAVNVIYPSSLALTGGETVTISGTTTVIAGPTTITDCPCTLASTLVVAGPTLTVDNALVGAVTGNAVIATSVVYPETVTVFAGETLTIYGTPTVYAEPTVITDCPCTKATTITLAGTATATGADAAGAVDSLVTVPATTVTAAGSTVTVPATTVTAFGPIIVLPVLTVVSDVIVTTSVTVISGVTVTAAPAASATGVADYETTVDGVTYLIEPETNYDTTELIINAKNKRQTTRDTLSICLKTCADNLSCVGTSFNTEEEICLYFSAIQRTTRSFEINITFATVISRMTPTGISTTSLPTSSANVTSTAIPTSSGNGTSTAAPTFTGTGSFNSTSAAPTSTASTNGTSSASSTTSVSATADPSGAPDADLVAREVVKLVAKATGLVLRSPRAGQAGRAVRRGGILRRSDAEPVAKHAARKAVIEL